MPIFPNLFWYANIAVDAFELPAINQKPVRSILQKQVRPAAQNNERLQGMITKDVSASSIPKLLA